MPGLLDEYRILIHHVIVNKGNRLFESWMIVRIFDSSV